MVRHHSVDARGTRIRVAEEGEGPVVLLVHGFPESWYSWRHQIPALAGAGFRAVAIDVRGYGRSSAPVDVAAYGMLQHVSDNLGVLEALGVDRAVVVGHDWGSPIAATSALLRPDVFHGVGLLSVPYSPPGRRRPTEAFAEMGAAVGEEFYINYFQQPGRAETEAETDLRGWLRGFYVSASGDAPATTDGGSIATIKPGHMMRDRFPHSDQLPSWLTEQDFEYYVEQFEYSGLRGPLNRYRNMDRDWVDLQPWRNRPIEVPAVFVAGEKDGPAIWGRRAIERHASTLPRGGGNHLISGSGHWVQQERPADVNRILLDWLSGLDL